MSFLRYDSPAMELISTITDMVILNLLCIICCIPIVTIGAAYTAKYYVAMKIVRHESTTVIKPFFRTFKENFKQSTIIWLILLAVISLFSIDWYWIYCKGFSAVPNVYLIAIGVLSALAVFVFMTVFPFIARFEVKTKEALKAGVIFSFVNFIPLAAIALLYAGTIIACIWYFDWFPLVFLFGTTTSMYFLCLLLVKKFKTLEESNKGVGHKAVYSESDSNEEKIFDDSLEEEKE